MCHKERTNVPLRRTSGDKWHLGGFPEGSKITPTDPKTLDFNLKNDHF